MMTETQELPDPEDVSTEYLTRPTPPSHEFRFRLKAVFILTAIVAVIFGLGRMACRL